MTLDEFKNKYGTDTLELLVLKSIVEVQTPPHNLPIDLQKEMLRALSDLKSVLRS